MLYGEKFLFLRMVRMCGVGYEKKALGLKGWGVGESFLVLEMSPMPWGKYRKVGRVSLLEWEIMSLFYWMIGWV